MAESGEDKKLEETNNDSVPAKEKKEEYKESVKVSPVCQYIFSRLLKKVHSAPMIFST